METANERIYRYLVDQMATGRWKPGARLPTETELAGRFDVTRETVRKALQQLKQQGQIVAQRGRGTFVAQRGRGTSVAVASPAISTNTVLLFVGDTESHFHRELYLALATEAQDLNQRMLVFNPLSAKGDWQERVHQLLEEVDWVIVEQDMLPLVERIVTCHRTNLVVTGYSRVRTPYPAYHVLLDVMDGMDVAMRHLVELGHRRIALVTPEDEARAFTEGPCRALIKSFVPAFRASLVRYDLESQGKLIYIRGPERFREENVEILQAVLRAPDCPTAFICDADFRASYLYEAARREGIRIPEDISVIGKNDTPWCAALTPNLTSVNVGEKAMARLVLALCGQGMPAGELVTRVAPHLAKRGSCKRLESTETGADGSEGKEQSAS